MDIMDIIHTHIKKSLLNFLLLCNTKSREIMLKVSVSCLSEEVFIHQTAGPDALEIVNLLRAQRDS